VIPQTVELELTPLDNNPLPVALSYNSYALFLNILQNSAPEIAARLHAIDGPKPFTTSVIFPPHQRTTSSTSMSMKYLSLRLAFLSDEIFAYFLKSALEWSTRELELGPSRFQVKQVQLLDVKRPHKNFCSYEELLSSAKAEHNISLQFLSPTVFRSKGTRNTLFPQPELVFGSLLNRWNTFSSLKLDTELYQCFESRILLTRYRLQTAMLNFGTYQEAGFTGQCNYLLNNALPEEQLRSINALAEFALYSGVGAKTTMGMGQVRRKKSGSALSNTTRSNSEKGG